MKNTFKFMLALMIGASAIVSCKKESPLDENNVKPEGEKILSFTAGVEGNGTKTTIDYADNIYKVNWCAGDEVLVMDGTHNGKYSITSGAGTGEGILEFANEGEAVTVGNPAFAIYPYAEVVSKMVTDEDILVIGNGDPGILEEAKWEQEACDYYISEGMDPDEVYAYYQQQWESIMPGVKCEMIMAYIKRIPYTKGPKINGNEISNLSIPDNQVVTAGQCVDPSIMLMAAKSSDSHTLYFKNVCSYIKVTLTEPCLKVTVTSRDGEFIAGNYTADFANAENPIVKCDSGFDTVTLTAAEGNLAPGTYYIAVGVSTLEYGLSIKYYRPEDGCFNANIRTSAFDITRNNVYDGGSNANATNLGAQWSVYVRSVFEDFSDYIKDNAVKMVFSTNVPVAAKPADAVVIGEGTSVWMYMDEQNVVHVETPAPKIWASQIAFDLNNFNKVEAFEGLENIDVTEMHNVDYLFYFNEKIEDLDLSSWRFVKITSAESVFHACRAMKNLTLNDTFDISDVRNLEDLVRQLGQTHNGTPKCVIHGISKESIKTAFKDTDHRDTGWNDEWMMFE